MEELAAVEVTSRKADIWLRGICAGVMLVIFALAVASSIVIVFLVGFEKMKLGDNVVLALIAATVAEIAGLLVFAAKYLFPSGS